MIRRFFFPLIWRGTQNFITKPPRCVGRICFERKFYLLAWPYLFVYSKICAVNYTLRFRYPINSQPNILESSN